MRVPIYVYFLTVWITKFCLAAQKLINWNILGDETYEISAFIDTNDSSIAVYPLLRLTIQKDITVCGFLVDPPSLALRLGPFNNVTNVYEITVSANGTDDLDEIVYQIQAETCQQPVYLSPKRPLRIYMVKPSHPKWTRPVFHINAPIHVNSFTTIANFSEFAIPSSNSSICNFIIEDSKIPLFSINATGLLRVRETDIDVEPGTVNTIRVKSLSCHDPPLSSIPALVIISYCSPRWSGISPILEHRSGDLRPMANARLQDCPEEPIQHNPDVLQLLPSLGCSATRAESVVDMFYGEREGPFEHPTPCPLNQYRLHKCGLRTTQTTLIKIMPEERHLYSGKVPLNVTESLIKTSHLQGVEGGNDAFQVSFLLWIRQPLTFPPEVPGMVPFEVLFYGKNLFGGKLSTLMFFKRGPEIGLYTKSSAPLSPTSWIFSSSYHLVEGEWVLMTVIYQSDGKEHDVKLFLGRNELEISAGPIFNAPQPLLDESPSSGIVGIVGAVWSPSDLQQFSHIFPGQIADMSLFYGAIIQPSAIECLLDCKPHLILKKELLRDFAPSTEVIWERPLHRLRVASSQAAQLSNVLQQLKVENLDVIPSTTLRLTSYIQCKGSNTTSPLPEVNITLIDTTAREDLSRPPDYSEEFSKQGLGDPCDYRLRLRSTSLQALGGVLRPISVAEAGRGQYLIPDAFLNWEASDLKCLEELEHLDVNVLSCNANMCGLLANRLQLGQEAIFVDGFSAESLSGIEIRFERTRSSYGIVGKASTDVYNDLLRHLAWKHKAAKRNLTRCVSIQCTATIQDDSAKILLFHRTNQVETQFRIVDGKAVDTSGVELIDLDNKRVFFDDFHPVAYPLHGDRRTKTHSWSYWVGVIILAVGLIVVLAGLVWVRNKSIRRRRYRSAPSFTQNFITTTVGYVAANGHCREQDEDDDEVEDRRCLDETEEDIWVPVIRPKFASNRSNRAEIKPKPRVHFKLNRISPPPSPPVDSTSSSESENESTAGFMLLRSRGSPLSGIAFDQDLLISDAEDATTAVSSTTHSVDYKHPLEWTVHDYNGGSSIHK